MLATGGQSNLTALQDFDFLLESVTPHKCFSLFLEERDKKNEEINNLSDLKYPLLIIIRKIKFITAQRIECQNILEEYNESMSNQG